MSTFAGLRVIQGVCTNKGRRGFVTPVANWYESVGSESAM